MAANRLPDSIGDLLSLAEDAADGAALHGTAIGIKQNDEATIRAVLSSARAARDAYRATQTACGDSVVITNTVEYEKAEHELRDLERRLAGIRKMTARIHEELAIYEGSEEAREPGPNVPPAGIVSPN